VKRPGKSQDDIDVGDGRALAICARYDNRPDAVIEIFLDLQEAYGCVRDEDVRVIANALNLSRAEVHGTRSFYTDLSSEPKGETIIKLCHAEACQSVGARDLIERMSAHLGLEPGETAADGTVTLELVACLGNCALGPAAMVDNRVVGRASVERVMSVGGDHG
jgi:formate dehydrogenase subunit gamma